MWALWEVRGPFEQRHGTVPAAATADPDTTYHRFFSRQNRPIRFFQNFLQRFFEYFVLFSSIVAFFHVGRCLSVLTYRSLLWVSSLVSSFFSEYYNVIRDKRKGRANDLHVYAAGGGWASFFWETVILSPRLRAIPCVLLRMRMWPVTLRFGIFSKHTLASASSPDARETLPRMRWRGRTAGLRIGRATHRHSGHDVPKMLRAYKLAARKPQSPSSAERGVRQFMLVRLIRCDR